MPINLSYLNLDQIDPNESLEAHALEQVHLGINEARKALHEVVGELGESLHDHERVESLHATLRCIEYRLAAVYDEADAGVKAALKRRNE